MKARLAGPASVASVDLTPMDPTPAPPYPHGDAIWEHKKGRLWALVGRMERENRWLRYQVRVLQARVARLEAQRRQP